LSFDKPIYEGKAKRIFESVSEPSQLRHEFKNSLTALNGLKKGDFEGKGKLNRDIASLLFQHLGRQGIRSHWIRNEGEISMITHRLSMLPVEVVVRNKVAGSLSKRTGLPEGTKLLRPIVEFYYKRDDLGDPFINDDHIEVLNLCTTSELNHLRKQGLDVNKHLYAVFSKAGLDLIDFKLEFGRLESAGEVLLADEISPDTCRLWDTMTQEKLDKDRFRRDMGGVDQAYQEVYKRLQAALT
jgi:phosphoribosylaminoimidazole-succinocarboxamide synthase